MGFTIFKNTAMWSGYYVKLCINIQKIVSQVLAGSEEQNAGTASNSSSLKAWTGAALRGLRFLGWFPSLLSSLLGLFPMISYSALTLLHFCFISLQTFSLGCTSTIIICGSEWDLYHSRVSGWQTQSKYLEYNYSLSPARHRLQIQILRIVKKAISMVWVSGVW